MSERIYAFNRRTVEDQVIFVRAASEREAKAKARGAEAFESSDVSILSATFRRMKGLDNDA